MTGLPGTMKCLLLCGKIVSLEKKKIQCAKRCFKMPKNDSSKSAKAWKADTKRNMIRSSRV